MVDVVPSGMIAGIIRGVNDPIVSLVGMSVVDDGIGLRGEVSGGESGFGVISYVTS